jgi:ABC-type transport system substrate-binding protein
MIVSIRPLRKFLVLALALLVLGGCGGDDEPTPPATQEGTVSEETTATSEPETTAVDPETETLPNDGDGTGTGESGPGGAGDEQAAETLALFTGRNGDITPRRVRVPAFISIRVELRSADGADYALMLDGRNIEVGEAINSLGVRFDGLRPGAKLVGKASTGGEVTVEATAEPGP